jgi:hypothetical protein
MDQVALDRLVSDIRTLSPVGVERVAWGWAQHERRGLEVFHRAERAALAAIEGAGEGEAWEAYRRSLFQLTEGGSAQTAWRAEHGELGHQAEHAAFGAALGVFAERHLSRRDYATLVESMAEALPWLLPEQPPHPQTG